MSTGQALDISAADVLDSLDSGSIDAKRALIRATVKSVIVAPSGWLRSQYSCAASAAPVPSGSGVVLLHPAAVASNKTVSAVFA